MQCCTLKIFIEIEVDDTPAVQAVINADTKRTNLLKDEQSLILKVEDGDMDANLQLKEVFNFYYIYLFSNLQKSQYRFFGDIRNPTFCGHVCFIILITLLNQHFL